MNISTPGVPAGAPWIDQPSHHRWLAAESDRLLRFHEANATEAAVGFAPLGLDGHPDTAADRDLYATGRLVHSFSIAHLMGRPGAATIAAHGLTALTTAFHDDENGGWFAAITPNGEPADPTKAAYAHAFVLLAASSALQAGIDGAAELLHEAASVIDGRFWREDEGAVVDALTPDWDIIEPGYRGQNANMHLTEAYMAAYEATGEPLFRQRAERIADLIINTHGRAWNWRVPEHFDASWTVVPDFNIDKPADPFRPYGALVGHWLEWARLILQLDALDGSHTPWAKDAADNLFRAAIRDGWDKTRTGFVYSVDFDGNPVNRDRMHWSIAEAIGAAAWLERTGDDSDFYERWYRTFWDHAAVLVLDYQGGSWWHQINEDGTPTFDTWAGKPDLYHAYQATLYARAGDRDGLAEAARRGNIR